MTKSCSLRAYSATNNHKFTQIDNLFTRQLFHTQVSVRQNSGYLPTTGRPAIRRTGVNMEAVNS